MFRVRFGIVLWMAVLASSFTFAQTSAGGAAPATPAPASEPAKFTSSAQLVLVPVIVTGKHGEHVTGLTRDAFHIEEHGKQRAASVFEEIKTVAADSKQQTPVSYEGQSNFTLNEGPSWRLTIVLMDTLNTPFLSQTEGKRRLISYLSKSLQREEPTVLLGLSGKGLRQLHPFTTDTAVLLAALNKLKGQVGADEMGEQSATATQDAADAIVSTSGSGLAGAEAQQVADFLTDAEATINAFQQRQSIRTTMLALNQIAHAYAAIPGRKTLIWAGGGFPFIIDDPQSFARLGTDMMDSYEETWRALMTADIAVYTVDVTGLHMSGSTAGYDASRRSTGHAGPPSLNSALKMSYDKSQQKQDSMRAFADATGGLACVNNNDLEGCFRKAVEDSQQYYLLGYYLPSDDMQPGWRKLKVKVDAEGSHVRAREGFYVSAPQENNATAAQRQLADALRSPLEYTGLRLNVREMPANATTKAAEGKSWHQFNIGVLGGSLKLKAENGNAVDLTVLTVAFDARQKNAGQTGHQVAAKLQPEMLAKVQKTGLGIPQLLELAPGKYELRVAVRDNLSGAVGSVVFPLEVK